MKQMILRGKKLVSSKRFTVTLALSALMALCFSFAAFASETPVDVTSALVKGFDSMAKTMIETVMASLPVVMSVMSAYLCINFGFRFFKKFAH